MFQEFIRFSMSISFALFLLTAPLSGAGSSQTKHGKDAHGMGVCKGFVVLSNGYAVLSGLDLKEEMSGAGKHGQMDHAKEMDHGELPSAKMSHGDKKMAHEDKEHGKAMASMSKDPLMGHKHGDSIKPMKGMLCVPLHGNGVQTWKTVSGDPALHLSVRSLRGKLDHNSRANEGFDLTVMYGGTPVKDAGVWLIAHMPQHDRMMPGGHGLANDPDVKGLMAKPSGAGRYSVRTVDFSMAGAWLFEVRVNRGGKISKAYFATRVGQE